MSGHERERGWCDDCGRAEYFHEDSPPGVGICPGCGSEMRSLKSLTPADRITMAFQDWLEEIHTSGKAGPSPGGAAVRLGCDRSMIDKLAERGILEKSTYNRDGHFVVMISDRSIRKAKANKEKRGKWTDSGED